ncbi:amidohydrolase family protein [Novosphingobium sp. RD2P27]|uniref:Amidohydrolase family protein n=1 Tax=Novosphingobium kalidii TaxID=3230299 RepID=A0ABV2D539_9SPHN
MLICDADVLGHGRCDLRIQDGVVAALGRFAPFPEEPVIAASGGALLPGLHDHHIHLAALAARAASVACGPPDVLDGEALHEALFMAPGDGWIRGVGYHESVLDALPDAATLDRMVPDRPVRIQHRSGRMWLLNSRALDQLLAAGTPPPGLERNAGRFTGRLFEEDAWLQRSLGSTPPDLGTTSAALARYGVTGVTDMSPRNDPAIAKHFAEQRSTAALLQRCVLAGNLSLANTSGEAWRLGPAKLHLHEAAFPAFGEAVAFIKAAHQQDRAVAVHCVSEVELVFALAAIEEAGAMPGDRIEHVSVASPQLLEQMARLNLHACVQPRFVAERGDRYLLDVEPRHHPDLYRLGSLAARGIPLAGGSDAPYGSDDPWLAMAAAVSRRTAAGAIIGPEEALDPEQALALYLADPLDFTRERTIKIGATADLCLLDRPWAEARLRLTSDDVAATFVAGEIIHQRVNEPPIQSKPGAEPTA